MARGESLELEVGGEQVTVSNPSKVYFPEIGLTKGELVDYYLAVADGALRGVAHRPMALPWTGCVSLRRPAFGAVAAGVLTAVPRDS